MNTTKSSVTCTNCGGQLLLDDDQSTVTCEYCGSQFLVSDLLDESDEIQLEKLRQRAAREKEKRKEEQRQQNEGKRFAKSIFGIFLIALTAICAALTVDAIASGSIGGIFAGLFSLAQTILFASAFLFGAKLIPEPFPKSRLYAMILAFLLFIPTGVLAAVFVENTRFFTLFAGGIGFIALYYFLFRFVKKEAKERENQNPFNR